MNTDRLSAQLTLDEGRKASAYPDTEGYLTIGVGHLIDQKLGGKLSPQVIDLQLQIDIEEAQAECETFGWFSNLNDARQNCVIEMMFQLGRRRFAGFIKFLVAMSTGDYVVAADQMLDSDVARKQPLRWDRLAQMMRTGEFS